MQFQTEERLDDIHETCTCSHVRLLWQGAMQNLGHAIRKTYCQFINPQCMCHRVTVVVCVCVCVRFDFST